MSEMNCKTASEEKNPYLEKMLDADREEFAVFQCLRRIYRLGFSKMTKGTVDFLSEMTSSILEFQHKAKAQGVELNPLTLAELETAFPIGGNSVEVVESGCEETNLTRPASEYGMGLSAALRRMKIRRGLLKDICRESRYAWQRAWRGFDDMDVGELGFNLVQRIPVLLREFKRKSDLLLRDPVTKRDYTKEETDAVINRLVFFFENTDEEDIYQRLYGISSWDAKYDQDRDVRVLQELRFCRAEAFRMLAKWCWDLWY